MVWSFLLLKPSLIYVESLPLGPSYGDHAKYICLVSERTQMDCHKCPGWFLIDISQMLLTALGVLQYVFWASACMLVHIVLHCCNLFGKL